MREPDGSGHRGEGTEKGLGMGGTGVMNESRCAKKVYESGRR